MKSIKLISVVGPTASGKTALAIDIANNYNGEIVCCDSMQLFDFAPIATAAPTPEERRQAVHHLAGVLKAGESCSVSRYADMAHAVIRNIDKRARLPVICGGTGLYYSAVADNIKFLQDGYDEKIRADLLKRADSEGLDALYDLLCSIDGEGAKKIERNDKKRILRGLEIYYATGMTLSKQAELSRAEPSPYELCAFGINFNDRSILYDRINCRVDKMIEQGLLKEAESIFKARKTGTGMQAIGVKELFPYFEGKISLDEAVNNIKTESRRYAKRQITWFKRDERINWIYADGLDRENIFKKAQITIEKFVKM